MFFTGHSHHAIDAKNRLAIPTRFRSQLDPQSDGLRLFVVPGRPSRSLWLYPENYFRRMWLRSESEVMPSQEQLQHDQAYFPWVELVDFDSQGRVLIPDALLRRAKLSKDVVVCGVRDHLEIHDQQLFDKQADEQWEHLAEYQIKARAAYDASRRQALDNDVKGST